MNVPYTKIGSNQIITPLILLSFALQKMSKRLNYAAENMQLALVAVRNGASQRAASRQYGVPRGTLQDKLAGRLPEVRKMDPGTVLTVAEEIDLAT